LLWIGQYYLVRFECSNQADLPDLEEYLNTLSKRASTASRYSGSSQGVAIRIRCRPSQLKGVIEIVEQAVNNTRRKSVEPVGYITVEGRENIKKGFELGVLVYLTTLISDSGISSWIQHIDLLTPSNVLVQQLKPILIKAAGVAIWPTIAAFLARAKKKI
jgi:hypothetical protein